MNSKDIKIRQDTLKNAFGEDNTIFIEEYSTGDLFQAENKEYILLDLFMDEEFGAKQLAKYVSIAEELYEKYYTKINIFIVAFNNVNVTVEEINIPSEADFTIRFAINQEEDMCKSVYDVILKKYEDGVLEDADLEVLGRLHLICDTKDKQFYLEEYLRIMTELN